jgi:class 3 adenylate cyclase/alpha-beta hydrolase superfamily lysophospholipase
VTEQRQVRWAKSGDVHVAYCVLGDGPVDLVWVPGAASHLECMLDQPAIARYFSRLASFARVLVFDKRGTGMSDRMHAPATLEERMDDVRAVMDAAGSERAAIVGVSEGGAIGALFAATYPERAVSLTLIGSGAEGWRPAPAMRDAIEAYVRDSWGSGSSVHLGAPSVADDPAMVEWFGRWERLSGSPGTIIDVMRLNASYDITGVLPAVSVPTLALHATGDRTIDVEVGRSFAGAILGARFVELDSDDHWPFFDDAETTLMHIEEFVTGERRGATPERVLSTVVFTDIVDSTLIADGLGDRAWRELLDAYDAAAERHASRLDGTVVKSTGDGTLARFPGPGRGIDFARAVAQSGSALGVRLRAGVHTGEIELRGDDIAGMAVVISQRISALAGADKIFVSRTVTDLVVGSDHRFKAAGEHTLKGVPGHWPLYCLEE